MKYLLLLFGLGSALWAQFPNIQIDARTQGGYLCEPSIAISPHDTSIVVAGAVLDRVYFSHDGGRTWEKETLKSPYGVFGDPNILAGQDGRFYYFHLANPDNNRESPRFLDRMVCQWSTDSGKTWSPGAGVGHNPPKVQDKEWSVEDPASGRVYLAWTQFDKYNSKKRRDKSNIHIAWSDNGGADWSDPVRINQKSGDCLDDDKTVEGAVPAVGPEGEVYTAWAYKRRIYFDRSLDGGKTWLAKDVKIARQPGGWNQEIPGIFRANGMPITVCDLSTGPHRGTVYVCWSDSRNGKDDIDIWLIRSGDQGETWSEPVRVNDDTPGHMQFFPWLEVDQSTGYLYCVYYDRRIRQGLATEVYVAFSTDGGRSFRNVKISEAPFTPNPQKFFGDYNDISAVKGKIMPIWTSMNPQGHYGIWTAILRHADLEKAAPK